MPEKYIDIRINITEEYDDIYTNYEVDNLEVHGTNLPSAALVDIFESLAQVDKYQLILANE